VPAPPPLLTDLAGFARLPFPDVDPSSPARPIIAAVRELTGDPRFEHSDPVIAAGALLGVVVAQVDFDNLVALAADHAFDIGNDAGALDRLNDFEEQHPFVVREDVAPGFLFVPQALINWAQEARASEARTAEVKAQTDRDAAAATGLPRAICYVRSALAYFPRTENGETWDLKVPMSASDAKKELISRGGMTPAEASTAINDQNVISAVTLDCDPAQGDTFQRGEHSVVNTYVPPTVKPEAGAWPVLSEVVDFLTAGDQGARRWLLNWCAFAFQNPARPMKTAPVLYGAQSTGKSLLARAMSELLGPSNCFTTDGEDLATGFTLHYATKLFLAVEEIDASDVPAVTTKLKRLTGAPKCKAVGKGSNAFEVPSRLKLMLMSNSVLPVKVEGPGDMRWSIFFQPTPPSDDYLKRMNSLFTLTSNEWTDTGLGELRAFAWHLKCVDVNVGTAFAPYRSAARDAAISASRTSVELFADEIDFRSFDIVRDEYAPGVGVRDAALLDRPDLVRSADIYAVYRAFTTANGNQPLAKNKFAIALKAARPAWDHNERTRAGEQRIATWSGITRARDLADPSSDAGAQLGLNMVKP
jgi:hypothetical protein